MAVNWLIYWWIKTAALSVCSRPLQCLFLIFYTNKIEFENGIGIACTRFSHSFLNLDCSAYLVTSKHGLRSESMNLFCAPWFQILDSIGRLSNDHKAGDTAHNCQTMAKSSTLIELGRHGSHRMNQCSYLTWHMALWDPQFPHSSTFHLECSLYSSLD